MMAQESARGRGIDQSRRTPPDAELGSVQTDRLKIGGKPAVPHGKILEN
jgi:hypothetical protein